ncbi:MAG: MurR/RpiR family transcriptional regulator [Spirochaetales bacterium]|jgi:DNA-binding MurR/RpiR family transcriptional regulator|nr:MurR/RpiR family transcriptional regulator [Spirochaetales bacterium]
MQNDSFEPAQNKQTSPNTDFDAVCQIKSKFDSMPKSYRKIADYLLENPNALTDSTITTLSRKVGSTPATITRFCQSLNFSGFPEFKFCMGKGILNSLFRDEKINQFETITLIKKKLHFKYIQAIEETITLISERDLKYAADSIMAAEKIAFFAHGGSGAVAQMLQVSFMQIGIPCYCFTDILMAHMIAEQLTKNDVAIGISNSGSAKTTVDALKSAKGNGVTTIGITGDANSLMMRYADIRLCYNARINDDLRYYHIARICETVIIGTLHTYILSHNYDKLKRKMQISKGSSLKDRY